MKRHLALAAAATLTLAARTQALPDLVASDPPAGWTLPALPRSSADATGGNCVLQAPALPGESANTWFNGSMHNIGTHVATNAFTGLYLDDGLRTIQGPFSINGLSYGVFVNNPSSVIIKGGRHTLLSRADVLGGVIESNESNNDWTRSYVWSPLALTLGAPVTRSWDPRAFTTGTGPWANCEGFSGVVNGPGYWYAFAACGTQSGDDFDVMLYPETPSNVPLAGFGAYSAWSPAQGDHTDLCVVNLNVAPTGTYYAGVQNWAGTGNKVVQFEMDQGTFWGPGVYGPYTMSAGDLVDVHELFGFTSYLCQIEVRPLSGNANIGATLIGTTGGGVAGLYDGIDSAENFDAGYSLWMDVTMAQDHFHGLVLYKRNSSDISKSITYEVIVSANPNLVAHDTYTGAWDSPIVPRNSADAGLLVQLPPTLSGDQPTTSFNYTIHNLGPAKAPPGFSNVLFVDDVPRWNEVTADTLWRDYFGLFENTPIGGPQSIVRGGRHHLRCDADAYNQLDEISAYEVDNSFTDWFVWTPMALADQTPVLRSAPPEPHPLGWGPYESCDGFRIPGFQGSYWTAVGVMTSLGDDYDVRLHDASAGSKDGFGGWLAESDNAFLGQIDFCIVNYNVASGVPRDVSVLNANQPNSSNAEYYVSRADAPYYGTVPLGVTRYGPMALPPHHPLNIHEFYFQGGVPTYISVNNSSGNAGLGVWLFDGTVPYHSRDTAMRSNLGLDGNDVHLVPVTFPTSGFYALVVAKWSGIWDVNSSTYEIVISTGGSIVDAPAVGAPLPKEFELSAPRPNPSRGGTSVELAVPSGAGKATVAVYDLAGRRVRSLVDGEATAGRRVLTWDGLDASGKRAAAGVYFVKLEAPNVVQTKKVTLLR
ncbi:MAG: FlgD immunoglobulin-like domain containing protein [bacterium]